MCDIPMDNLIDFNVEEEPPNTNCDTKSFATDHIATLIPSPSPRLSGITTNLSLENNPFDSVQKLTVYRSDDPFDIVEIEASLKARQIRSKSTEVKLGNLLSLSDDNETTTDSNNFYTAEEHNLENESPPMVLSSKWSPCSSTASCESSDSNKDQAIGTKARKTGNHRNRLLKLSISNAAFSTPNSSRPALDKEEGFRNELSAKLVSLSPGDNENSNIDSESPVKLMDEVSLKSEKTEKQNYTEADYDHDLKLMEIPMLKQISSPEKTDNKENLLDFAITSTQPNIKSNQLPDLEILRQKLRVKRLESSGEKDISELINVFKNLISESKMIDDRNKHDVEGLLENLTSTLFAAKTSPNITPPPQPIVRQGTFDMDLQDKQPLLELHTAELIGQPAAIVDMPEQMFKSSATYDGEPAEEKTHLNLPQIDPPSQECSKQQMDANVRGIIEQLQQFLEQQHLSADSSDASSHASSAASTTATTSNPTFILVMPTITQNSPNEESYDDAYSHRRRSQSLSLHDKLKIVQLPIKPVPEIEVTENYESPPLNTSSIYNTPLSANFVTPARFLERRNSFTSATHLTPTRFNRSIINKERSSGLTPTTPMQISKFGLRNETQQPVLVQRPTLGIKPDPKKKVRTMSSSSLPKTNGPLKATLPFKQISSTSSTFNTSMHFVSKAGQMSHTSTPMPAARSNGSKPLNKLAPNFPTSTSTGKSTASSLRFSNIGTTPISKTLPAPVTSTAHLRRRTVSELKTKSPIKTRSNFSNIKSNLRSHINNTTKSINRPSFGGNYAHPASKNKENKQPLN